VKNQSGSLVLLPLKRLQRQTCNGVLAIDTIREKKEKAFVQHEVQFYEGVATILADTLTFMDFERLMLNVFRRFLFWIEKFGLNTNQIDYYAFEPISMTDPKERVLKHTMTYSQGNLNQFQIPIVIDSREQIFK